MLFDLAYDDEPTMILVREEDVSLTAEPPALPFPLLRRKGEEDAEEDAGVVFELVPRASSAVACA